MPRKNDFTNVKPAMSTIHRIREQKCFQKYEDDVITEHDTIQDVVATAKSCMFEVRHTYLDRYCDGQPTKQLSETELAMVHYLCYDKFIRPTIVEKDEEEYDNE